MSTLNHMRRQRFINALVSDCKLKYVESDEQVYKLNTVCMPPFDPSCSKEQEVLWMERLITQCYHHLPDNRADLLLMDQYEIDASSGFGQLYQHVCKNNAQQKRKGVLYGADGYVEQAYDLLIRHSNPGTPQEQAFYAFDASCRASTGLSRSDYALPTGLNSEAQKLYEELTEACAEQYCSIREAGQDNYHLAKRIAEILNIENNSNEEGKQSDAEQSSDGKDKENQQGSAQDGEGEGQGSSDGEAGDKEERESNAQGTECKPFSLGGDGIDPSEIGQNKNFNPKLAQTKNRIEPLDVVPVHPKLSSNNSSRRTRILEYCNNNLSTKVRNVLKVLSQARYTGGKKRGKINKRAIAGITTGNERIFRAKEVKDVLDTCVMLLVDSSGSMSGSRYTHASAAATMLVDCLQKINIPVSVQGFTTGSKNYEQVSIQYIHKGFNERKSKEEMVDSFMSRDVSLMGNADAEALLYAYDNIMRQKQKRKIIIVLSDGQPVDGSNPFDFLQLVAKDIEKSKGCELYGIGIETNEVKYFYSNYIVINNTNELEENLLTLIKEAII